MRVEDDQVCGNHTVKALNGKPGSWVYAKSTCNVPSGKPHKAFDPSGDMTLTIT